jgi:prefoldin subunit 5
VIETQRQTIQHQREELAGQLQTLGIAQHSVVSCNKDFQTLVTSCKK